MSITPIYDQLVAELGEQRSPAARVHAAVGQVFDTLAGVGVVYPRRPTEESYRQRRIFWRAFCGPLPAPLVLEEPIYDGLVNEMGYPHCSPVEALVSYTHRPPASCREPWQRALVAYGQPIVFTARTWLTGDPE